MLFHAFPFMLPAFHFSFLPSLSPSFPLFFRISAPYTLFIFESVFLGLRCYRQMFVRLLVPPLIFASFIRSISRVISSFFAFHVSNACLDSTGAMGRVPLPPPSREDSTTRAFTLVNVYGCPIASRNCRSLSLCAKCCAGGAEEACSGEQRPACAHFQRRFTFYCRQTLRE